MVIQIRLLKPKNFKNLMDTHKKKLGIWSKFSTNDKLLMPYIVKIFSLFLHFVGLGSSEYGLVVDREEGERAGAVGDAAVDLSRLERTRRTVV